MKLAGLLCAAALVAAPAAQATVRPEPSPADSRIQVVHYQPDEVVELRGEIGFATSIEFDPAERLETVAVGDARAWQVSANRAHSMLFIKPMLRHGPTNMTVLTSLRRYDFTLIALPRAAGAHAAVFAVRFAYPPPPFHDAVVLKPAAAPTPPPPTESEPRNARYSFQGSPELRPARVFDDGVLTVFEFAQDQDYPAIYAVEGDGKEAIMNFSVKPGRIIVDKVARAFVLRRGGLVARVFNDGFANPVAASSLPAHSGRGVFAP